MSIPKTQRFILPAFVASLALSGCASMQGGTGDQAIIAQSENKPYTRTGYIRNG